MSFFVSTFILTKIHISASPYSKTPGKASRGWFSLSFLDFLQSGCPSLH